MPFEPTLFHPFFTQQKWFSEQCTLFVKTLSY